MKKLKNDLKAELTEKIEILKELDSLKKNQMNVFDKQESLKSYFEKSTKEKDKYEIKLKNMEIDVEKIKGCLEKKEEEFFKLDQNYRSLKEKYSAQIEVLHL